MCYNIGPLVIRPSRPDKPRFWKREKIKTPSPLAWCDTVCAMAWPTTSNPRTEFVTLRLTADEAASLDDYAQKRGLTRSAALRDAVTRVTAADARNAKRAEKKKRAGADE